MHNRDLVLALSDDIVVRQRLGNHAPWPAMQSIPRSDFSPQFRSPATTSWALHLDAYKSATSLGERTGRRTQGLPRMLHGPSGGPCYRPRYLNTQRLNYLWTIRHSSARIAGNLVT